MDKKVFCSDEEIEKICSYHNLQCYFASGGLVFIKSSIGNWRILHDNCKNNKLYHENYKCGMTLKHKKHKKFSEGYHQQKVNSSNMFEAIKYIYCHDEKLIGYKNYNKNLVPNISSNVIDERR